jgi:hypothetical protein
MVQLDQMWMKLLLHDAYASGDESRARNQEKMQNDDA